MVVTTVHQPDFIGHSRGVWSKRVILPLHVHYAFALLLLLTNGVAEDAALFIFKPFVRGAKLVLDSPGHENRCRHLRMGVRPFLTRQRTLILEYTDVLESRI